MRDPQDADDDGCVEPTTSTILPGTVLSPAPGAVVASDAVVGQAACNALFGAMEAVACSQAAMNGFLSGDGERHYHEAICGLPPADAPPWPGWWRRGRIGRQWAPRGGDHTRLTGADPAGLVPGDASTIHTPGGGDGKAPDGRAPTELSGEIA